MAPSPPRTDFPILARKIEGKPLVYLDNAATTQKPRVVIDAISRFLSEENANIHRGVHYLSRKATDAYEGAREIIASALGASNPSEIIFTRGTTEGINLVAHSLGSLLPPDSEILLTVMEHHANLVPWQMLAKARGLRLSFIPVNPSGDLDQETFHQLLDNRPALVAFTHVSNVIGTVNPVKAMIREAKAVGAIVLVDGAQAVPHFSIDVAALGCDFYVFSGHKMFGPDGIGVLWGKQALLQTMPPFMGGGDMIERVTLEKSTYRPPPSRFEAGTPPISGALGLAAAFTYLQGLDQEHLARWESNLVNAAIEKLSAMPGVRIIGNPAERCGVVSFVMDGVHPHDIGTILDSEGVAVRAGHHCAQPLMDHLGVTGTVRASFAFYNTEEEVDLLVAGVEKVRRYFG